MLKQVRTNPVNRRPLMASYIATLWTSPSTKVAPTGIMIVSYRALLRRATRMTCPTSARTAWRNSTTHPIQAIARPTVTTCPFDATRARSARPSSAWSICSWSACGRPLFSPLCITACQTWPSIHHCPILFWIMFLSFLGRSLPARPLESVYSSFYFWF